MSPAERMERIILEEAKKSKGHIGLKLEILGVVQYEKWLSLPRIDIDIESISMKNCMDATLEELNKYKECLEENKAMREMKIFLSDEWYNADILVIHNFIYNHPLSEIKKTRLTKKEYKQAIDIIHQIIGNYSEEYINRISNPNTALNPYYHEKEKEGYNELTPIQAFISDFYYNLEFQDSLNASSVSLNNQIKRNDMARLSSEQSAKRYFVQ